MTTPRVRWPPRVTIRVKLTIGFVLAMSLVLGATGGFLYVRFAGELNRTIDRGLRAQVEAVRTLVAQTDNGLRESGPGLSSRNRSFAQVLRGGRVVDFTVPLSRPLVGARVLARAARGQVTLERRSAPGIDEPVRLLVAPVTGQDGRREVAVVGTLVADRTQALTTLSALLALGGAGALALAGAVGYGLSSVTLRTVESMRRRAQTLSLSDPGGRLPVGRAHDELWRLGNTLNEMLARNEAAFARERTFVADASHELRTPLTILRAELEIALRAGSDPAEIRRAVSSAMEESERLTRLADDLLLVTRADQGRLPTEATAVGVQAVLQRVAERFEDRAAEQGRALTIECPEPLSVPGERDWIERAIENLVDNALHYGEGTITLSAGRRCDRLEIHVLDGGGGFAPAFLPSAFERFRRGAPSRRSPEGTGVGLSIVQSIAHAHGGEADAANRPTGGADVWISLPAGVSSREWTSSSPEATARSRC